MAKPFQKFFISALIFVILGFALVSLEYAPAGTRLVEEGGGGAAVLDSQTEVGRQKPIIPSGRQEYQIMQAAGRWPKILEAVIDPPDVHVGDTQRLEVVVQSREPIKSVEARIETDNDTVILPLELVGPVADVELMPSRYAVLDNGAVAIAPRIDKANKANSAHGGSVAYAESEPPKLKYAGEWVVRDTHDAFYHTTFVVKDAAGNENSITMAWSDACGIAKSGNWTMSSNCTISSVDGVDNGNATLSSGTLTLNSTFAFNSGRSVTISGGTIAIGSGGKLQQTNLWGTDSDGDDFLATSYTQVAQDTEPANYSRRWSSGLNDCLDSNAAKWVNAYTDVDGDNHAPNSTQTCVGSESGYTVSASGFSDCNDNPAGLYVYQLTAPFSPDYDLDRYALGDSFPTQCIGNTIDGGNYYRNFDGSYTMLHQSYSLGVSDCNDNSSYVQVDKNTYADADSDCWGVFSGTACLSANICTTLFCTNGGKSKSTSVDGNCTSITNTNGTDTNDSCYDTNNDGACE